MVNKSKNLNEMANSDYNAVDNLQNLISKLSIIPYNSKDTRMNDEKVPLSSPGIPNELSEKEEKFEEKNDPPIDSENEGNVGCINHQNDENAIGSEVDKYDASESYNDSNASESDTDTNAFESEDDNELSECEDDNELSESDNNNGASVSANDVHTTSCGENKNADESSVAEQEIYIVSSETNKLHPRATTFEDKSNELKYASHGKLDCVEGHSKADANGDSSAHSLYYTDDSGDENEVVNYLTRGPLTEHKNSRYRFTPMQSPEYRNSDRYPHYSYAETQFAYNEGLNSGVNFDQISAGKSLAGTSTFCFTGESSSEFLVNSTQSFNEFCDDDWTKSTSASLENPFSGEAYLPLSPPQSVSPILKDGQYAGGYFENCDTFCDEAPRESEDLISIINSINETSKAEPNLMPEAELLKLRNVLEGDELSIRNEMGMYLKEEASLSPQDQEAFPNQPDDAHNDFSFGFDVPLTPPKSVSPVQEEALHYGYNSSYEDYNNAEDFKSSPLNADSDLTDILNGIQEIVPDELNIYLNEEKNSLHPPLVRAAMQSRCTPSVLDHALRRLSSVSAKHLWKPDGDGDTCLMIVYSKPEDSPAFYENIFCLQEKMLEIRLCCDAFLGKAKKCKVCGNFDTSKFYSPLSMSNNHGDTALSCAVKRNHSAVVVDFLLCGILQNHQDRLRLFNECGKMMLTEFAITYPNLTPFL